MRIRSLVPLVLLPAVAALPLCAADGTPDPTFSGDGKVVVTWDEPGETYAEAVAAAPFDDGSTIVAGTLTWVPPGGALNQDWVAVKLTRAGVVDVGWGENGRRRIAFEWEENGFDELLGAYPEPDGAVLLVGWTSAGERPLPAVVRLLSNGDPDPAFGVGGFVILTAVPWSDPQLRFVAAARQRDGKLLLGGYCTNCPSNSSHFNPLLLRLRPDGTPDSTFSFDGWAAVSDGGTTSDILSALAPAADGGVVFGMRSDGEPRLVRLNAFGGFDSTFGGDGIVEPETGVGSYTVADVVVDPASDEVYAVMSVAIFDSAIGYVERLGADGIPDGSWGENAGATFVLEDGVFLTGAVLQGDRRLVVVGEIDAQGEQRGGFFLARLDESGQRDDTFHDNGIARYEFDRSPNADDVASTVVLAGGKPLAVGYAESESFESAFAVLRVENSYLFVDGFEAGEPQAWSGGVP